MPLPTNDLPCLSATTGFPSPATDYQEAPVDLVRLLVWNRPATFLVRAEGDGMCGAGIWSGDVLVVDRSIRPRPGCVVIAAVDGGLTVRRLVKHKGRYGLTSDPTSEEPASITDGLDAAVWGVVTNCLHRLYPL